HPIATGSTPYPFFNARNAAWNAGGLDSVYHQPAASSAWTSTSRPHGAAFFRASTTRRCTSAGSRFGTSRTPIRAHADSEMMLRASFLLLAWNALTAIDG